MQTKIRRITKSQFIGAFRDYMDEEGCSCDEWDCNMNWLGFKTNRLRSDGKTEQEVWTPLLLPRIPEKEDDSVEITVDENDNIVK